MVITETEAKAALKGSLERLHKQVSNQREPGAFSTAEYAEINGISMREAEIEVKRALRRGLIARTGSKPYSWRYVMSEKDLKDVESNS